MFETKVSFTLRTKRPLPASRVRLWLLHAAEYRAISLHEDRNYNVGDRRAPDEGWEYLGQAPFGVAGQRIEVGASVDTDEVREVATERSLLERALPMLVRLGDFIGNGEIDPTRSDSLGERCDLIGDIRARLDESARRPAGGLHDLDDAGTLDRIAFMLRDPDWGVGMLEDIAELVARTARDLESKEEGAWDRH